MNNLAIVIPAYKDTFLVQTLESIANQTNKNFTLYVGDDCSPYDIKTIIDKYTDKIDLHYTRFETNLGGRDLVAQWERCIDLTQGEPWLWMFSDDDVMEPDCVETFFSYIRKERKGQLLRFNVDVVDEGNRFVRSEVYPQYLCCEDFYKKHTSGKICCFVVEYIFSRKLFLSNGRFQNFDLAWGSDVVTWLKLSKEEGIITLPNSRVLWRASGENITTLEDINVKKRKLYSSIAVYSYYSKFWGRKYHYRNLFGLVRVMWGQRFSFPISDIFTALNSFEGSLIDRLLLKIGTLFGPRILYKNASKFK